MVLTLSASSIAPTDGRLFVLTPVYSTFGFTGHTAGRDGPVGRSITSLPLWQGFRNPYHHTKEGKLTMATGGKMIRLEDPWEQQAYRGYFEAAERGTVAPRYPSILEKLDCCDGGTIANVDDRLVRAGHILVMPFNRSRMIYVMALGKWTAIPKGSLALPWRDRFQHAGRTRRRGAGNPAWVFQPLGDEARAAARQLRRLVGPVVIQQWQRELGLIQAERVRG